MREVGGRPIWREITSMKELSSDEQRRVKQLKEIFRKEEGRIPPGTSIQERRYLFRLEAGRRRSQRRRWIRLHSRKEWKEWEEAMKKEYPLIDRPIEEILDLLSARSHASRVGMSEAEEESQGKESGKDFEDVNDFEPNRKEEEDDGML